MTIYIKECLGFIYTLKESRKTVFVKFNKNSILDYV